MTSAQIFLKVKESSALFGMHSMCKDGYTYFYFLILNVARSFEGTFIRGARKNDMQLV